MPEYKPSLLALLVFTLLAFILPTHNVEASFTQTLVPYSKGLAPHPPTCTGDWLTEMADYNTATYCTSDITTQNKSVNYHIDPNDIISSSSYFNVQLQITYKTPSSVTISVQVHKPDESSYQNYILPTLHNTGGIWENAQIAVYDTYTQIGQSLNFTRETLGSFSFGYIFSTSANPMQIASFRIIITDEDTSSMFPNLASPSFGLTPFNCGTLDIPCQIASGFYKVITYLFVPSDNDWNNIKNSWNGLWETIKAKPPIGYFTSVKTAFDNLTPASGSYYLTLGGLDSGDSPLAPLKTGLIWILWFMLAFWILHRIRQLEI